MILLAAGGIQPDASRRVRNGNYDRQRRRCGAWRALTTPLAGSLFIAEILFGTHAGFPRPGCRFRRRCSSATTHVLNGSDSLLHTVHLDR